LALDDGYALFLSLKSVAPPYGSEKLWEQASIATALDRYNRTRRDHVSRVVLAAKNISKRRQEAADELGLLSDQALRELERTRPDPWWIHEHDIIARFEDVLREEVVAKL
jgi:salicylate hydroxylase